MPSKPARTNRPVTQADIAQVAGCSQNTVALALRQSPRISAARRREIARIAERLGYRANVAARSLRRGRTGLIGLFTGQLDFVRLRYARQMLAQLHTTEYKPILGTDDTVCEPWYDATWIQTLRELQVEALVSFAWHDKARLPAWHKQVPVIFSGFSTPMPPHCDCINMDRRGAGRMATEYLLSRGTRKVEMVTANPAAIANDGYHDAMRAAGLRPVVFLRQDNRETEEELARRYLHRLKARKRAEPLGVFAISSPMAAWLCNAARDSGLRVPQDLAVVGYDYMEWADRLAVPLTIVEQPIDELVQETVKAVRARLADPEAEHVRMTLPFRLVQRVSA